jgi:NDP-sugar pyrophosphorylase family protein
VEKPSYQYSVSTGIYIFEPGILNYIPTNQRFDLPDLVKKLINSNQKVGAYRFDGYWLDIGRHDDYQTAIDEFRANASAFLPEN